MIFDREQAKWESLGGWFTTSEIYQQPNTWRKTKRQMEACKYELQAFLNKVVGEEDFDVILTGAGTSEFVGNAVFAYLNTKTNHKCKSYATTDIVSQPEFYLSKDKPTLLISYGRSGNSPESMGAVEIAQGYCSNVYHLIITCNAQGELATFAKGRDNCYLLALTKETHDQSFAMTSSFTNMYLATLLAFGMSDTEVHQIIDSGEHFLKEGYSTVLDVVVTSKFKRIVYLGSDSLKGVAQEASLKLLELTQGDVVTCFDTPLGFRHGPKSIVNPDTLIVVFLSDDSYTKQYELDFIKEVLSEKEGNKVFVVGSQVIDNLKGLDYSYSFKNPNPLPSVTLGLEYILVAQVLALYKSVELGFTPDNPCPSGKVNRVVKGVTIYPYPKKGETL